MDYATRQFRYDKLLQAFCGGEPILPPILPNQREYTPAPRPVVGSSYSCRIFPNGEFGVGYVAPTRKSAEDARQDRGEILGRRVVEVPSTHELEDGSVYTDTSDIIQVLPPKLGIGAESSQRSRKYGLKGISSYGRKMIRNAGHCLDVAFKSRYGCLTQMGTLTIPSLEPDRMSILCSRWGDIVRRFFQECKRAYKRMGFSFDYVSCTEIQPKRWEARREVGLHLHFLFVSFRLGRNEYSMPDQWVRDTWRRVICRYVGEQSVPLQLNYRREAVKQSSAAYIAKYASKGTEFIQEVVAECGEGCVPSQWWSMSASLKNCIKRTTQISRSDQAELLLHVCKNEMMEYLRYLRIAEIPGEMRNPKTGIMEPYNRVIGYGGLLSLEGRKMFQSADINSRIRLYLPGTLDKVGVS